MLRFGFFENKEQDDAFLARWAGSIVKNGVLNGSLGVSAGSGMVLKVGTGQAWVNGRYVESPEGETVGIEAAASSNRYDSIVLRLDLDNPDAHFSLVVLKGTPGSSAIPAPVRTNTVHDMKLAHVLVPAGAVAISAANITDTRQDENVCGIADVLGSITEAASRAVAAQQLALTAKQQADEAAAAAKTAQRQASESEANAQAAAETVEDFEVNPVRVGENGNFWNWDSATGEWVDSGKDARGPKGDKGERGLKGDTGKPFTILGYYGTLAALKAAVPNPSPGDAYGVGTAAPYTIYVYDGVATQWLDTGTMQGPKGDKGENGAKGENGFDLYTHTKSGTVHNLTLAGGSGNIKFVATAAFAQGDTFKVNGTTCTAQTQEGKALPNSAFAAGAVVSCFRNGNVLNFKSGGAAKLVVMAGTTRPQSPALNAIWVYTSTPVGEVRYSTAPPSSATGGDVWLKAGYSRIRTEIDGITWSPVAVCQYESGTWVPKPAAWYNGSAWEPIYPVDGLLIYNRCNGSYVNEVDGTLPNAVGADLTFFQDATAGTVGLAKGSYYSNLSYTSPAFLRMKQYTMAITFKTAMLTSIKCLLSVGILNNNLNVQLRINKSTPNTGGAELFGQALTSQSVIEPGPNRADSQWHSAMAVVPGQPDPAKVIVDGNQPTAGNFANYPGGDSFTCCSDLATPKPTYSTVFDGAFANIMLYNRALDDYEARCLSITMQHRVKGLI